MKRDRKKSKKNCPGAEEQGRPTGVSARTTPPARTPMKEPAQAGTTEISPDARELLRPLSEMAMNAWRLKVRMIDPDSGEPKEETRKLYRFVEGLFRAMDDAGIQIVDKRGKRYDAGMPEKVLSFERTPGLVQPEITDTIRPTIRWKDQPLCYGEIIVGTPADEHAASDLTPASRGSSVQRETPPDVGKSEPAEAGVVDRMPCSKEAVATRADRVSDRPAIPLCVPNW